MGQKGKLCHLNLPTSMPSLENFEQQEVGVLHFQTWKFGSSLENSQRFNGPCPEELRRPRLGLAWPTGHFGLARVHTVPEFRSDHSVPQRTAVPTVAAPLWPLLCQCDRARCHRSSVPNPHHRAATVTEWCRPCVALIHSHCGVDEKYIFSPRSPLHLASASLALCHTLICCWGHYWAAMHQVPWRSCATLRASKQIEPLRPGAAPSHLPQPLRWTRGALQPADGCLNRLFAPSPSFPSSSCRGGHITIDGASPAGSTPGLTSMRPPWHHATPRSLQRPPRPSVHASAGVPSIRQLTAMENRAQWDSSFLDGQNEIPARWSCISTRSQPSHTAAHRLRPPPLPGYHGSRPLPCFSFGYGPPARVAGPVLAQGTKWPFSFILGNLNHSNSKFKHSNSYDILLNLEVWSKLPLLAFFKCTLQDKNIK
jgi:hypothetical protein